LSRDNVFISVCRFRRVQAPKWQHCHWRVMKECGIDPRAAVTAVRDTQAKAPLRARHALAIHGLKGRQCHVVDLSQAPDRAQPYAEDPLSMCGSTTSLPPERVYACCSYCRKCVFVYSCACDARIVAHACMCMLGMVQTMSRRHGLSVGHDDCRAVFQKRALLLPKSPSASAASIAQHLACNKENSGVSV
jgi:hypothetical protein